MPQVLSVSAIVPRMSQDTTRNSEEGVTRVAGGSRGSQSLLMWSTG